MTDPVLKTVTVPCPPETAFRIFAEDFASWWPKNRHSVSAMDGGAAARSVKMEPRVGGQIWEIGADGTRHNWGSVRVYDPYVAISLSWHINKPASEATVVDIVFSPKDAGTEVTLTHHGWEVLADAADTMRDNYNKGWVHVFETCFTRACAEVKA